MPGAVLARAERRQGAEDGSLRVGEEAGSPALWRGAQGLWSATPIAERLAVLKAARHWIAGRAGEFAEAVSPDLTRSRADTMVAEVLPLLDGCRFLEREAARILATRRLGRRGLPLWLSGIDSEVQRVAMGKVLVVGPANYPLFLPGVQTLQALAAGNAVVWKPGRGGKAVADLFARAMVESGLPRDLLRVTEESVEAGRAEIAAGADKVFFTGSAETGRGLLRELAATCTPSVMELSGCDGVVVLQSADVDRVVQALTFGMRFNGSATCMAPRRVFLVGASAERRDALVRRIGEALERVKGVVLAERTRRQLAELIEKAERGGAHVHDRLEREQRPVLVTNVLPGMEIAQADVFAPVLSLLEAGSVAELTKAMEECPYALTAAVFGAEDEARRVARELTAGTVLVNDLIVPTVDPRLPFGGRRQSGFGVTRGAEGLLEMTTVKVVSVRRNHRGTHYEPTTVQHEELFRGVIEANHAGGWRARWQGMRRLVRAARGFKGGQGFKGGE